MMLHSHLYYHLGDSIKPQKGEKMQKGLSSSSFLAINAKGGESIKPKAKGPHTIFNFFCIFQIGFSKRKYFSIDILFVFMSMRNVYFN
jgi:hypothetical protein